MTEFLTVDQVIEIHNELLHRYGGLEGIRDVNLLHSSVFLPQTAAFGQDLCPSIYDKAAAYIPKMIQKLGIWQGDCANFLSGASDHCASTRRE